MSASKLLDHAKEQYVWEAQRRDKLNASGSIPIGFATLGGTVIAPVASKIRPPYDWIDITLLALVAAAIILGIVFVYNTVRFFLGPVYQYVADCDSVVKFWHDSNDHYASYPQLGNIDDKFDEFLLSTYSRCATINCHNNDEKSRRLYLMNRWVLTLILPCLLSAALVAFAPVLGFGLNGEKLQMAENTPPPPPPSPPPERGIKDGANVQRPKQQ